MRQILSPYRLLVAILYSHDDAVERELPLVVCSTDAICKRLKVTPRLCQENLVWLEENGLIRDFKWHSHYFTVNIIYPVGMLY